MKDYLLRTFIIDFLDFVDLIQVLRGYSSIELR